MSSVVGQVATHSQPQVCSGRNTDSWHAPFIDPTRCLQPMKPILALASLATLMGCAATATLPGAQNVEIVSEAPDRSKCRFIAEVVGSQGNWITGDITSNKNLIIGARNELRNEAHKLGGNVVYIQEMKNTNAHKSLGTTNTTAVGKAYACAA